MRSASALLLVLILQTGQAQAKMASLPDMRTSQLQENNARNVREKRGVFDILPNRHVQGTDEGKDTSSSGLKLLKNKLFAMAKSQTQMKSRIKTIVQNYFSNKSENQINLRTSITHIVKKQKFVLQKMCRRIFGMAYCRILPKYVSET